MMPGWTLLRSGSAKSSFSWSGLVLVRKTCAPRLGTLTIFDMDEPLSHKKIQRRDQTPVARIADNLRLTRVLVVAFGILLGSCSQQVNQGGEARDASAVAGEKKVREALQALLVGPVKISFEIEDNGAILEEDQYMFDEVEQNLRMRVDKDGNWEMVDWNGAVRVVGEMVYLTDDSDFNEGTTWDAIDLTDHLNDFELDGYDGGTKAMGGEEYLKYMHETVIGFAGLGGLFLESPDEKQTWWGYCIAKGDLSGEGENWVLECPPIKGFKDIAYEAMNSVFKNTAEAILRDAAALAASVGQVVDNKVIAQSVAEAGIEGALYDAETGEFSMSFPNQPTTCRTIIQVNANGDPEIKQIGSLETPCGSGPEAEPVIIKVNLRGLFVNSLETSIFSEDARVRSTVYYDRNLPADYSIKAPKNIQASGAGLGDEQGFGDIGGLIEYSQQVARNAAAIAAMNLSEGGRVSTNDVARALEGETGIEVEIYKTGVSIRAIGGPDAGCVVVITPSAGSTKDAHAMVGPLQC